MIARVATLALLLVALAAPARATLAPETVLRDWYRLTLELVRHTATYSPPVASRAFAYIGVTIHEAQVTGNPGLVTLAGQLNGLTPVPPRGPGQHDEAAVLQGALAVLVPALFDNTGPTGQRALETMQRRLTERATGALDPAVAERSLAYGRAVAGHVLAWAATDGGASVANLGFPVEWTRGTGPQAWVPTSAVALQQAPLLPRWGENRPFVLPSGAECRLPPPPAYSEDPASQFRREAQEVYDTVAALTPDQLAIARFWSDDPMLSSAPPGHWVAIAVSVFAEQGTDAARQGEVMALLGVSLADAFIVCWRDKYDYDLVRPVSYIRRVIDPRFEPPLITPPFPEYPSGHSTQSGAAAVVLTHLFGEPFTFVDNTHADDGLPGRTFASFWDAAEEAGISRLYGGIHFRSAIREGLEQGRCVGEQVIRLRTRR
ncbi:MAG: vanadium-dependent haloperoxidase [Paracoccaceae bacterium]|nr:MAG: vanadium-dependent haloperoxidase [Paracoccaceae bacterium]